MDVDLLAQALNDSGPNLPGDPFRQVAGSLFAHQENGESHYSYESEQREMLCIEQGDTQRLKECWGMESGKIGQLSLDGLRNTKYLCVVNIALSARAATRGGVPCELAYSLCDTYCQQIDALTEKDLPQVEGIVRNIQLTYAKLVAAQNGSSGASSKTPHLVLRAKEYISSHLHGKLTATDVAKELNIHPVYLNRLFKEAEGVTVHDYIMREKINHARSLLTYSDHFYDDIANYLGFSSQSHLGANFKKYTGMTLKQYKDAYHKSGGKE